MNKEAFKGVNNVTWDRLDPNYLLEFSEPFNAHRALPMNVQQHSILNRQQEETSSNEIREAVIQSNEDLDYVQFI